MAKQRYINTKFWSDSFIRENLDPIERYVFLYLLTNEKTNIAGVYELPISTICFETGIEKKHLLVIFEHLKPKIYYIKGWVYIKNFQKHQRTGSTNIEVGIQREMQLVPIEIIGYIEGIDTLPIDSELLGLLPIPILKPICAFHPIGKSDGEFDIFWNLYNKKIDKGACEKKWNKLKNTDKQKIIESLPVYLATIKDKQFQKNPKTYLNNRSRENEYIGGLVFSDEIDELKRYLDNDKSEEIYNKRGEEKYTKVKSQLKRFIMSGTKQNGDEPKESTLYPMTG